MDSDEEINRIKDQLMDDLYNMRTPTVDLPRMPKFKDHSIQDAPKQPRQKMARDIDPGNSYANSFKASVVNNLSKKFTNNCSVNEFTDHSMSSGLPFSFDCSTTTISTISEYHREPGHRSDLSIFKSRDQIVQRIEGSQIAIICGPTGCGKSTQVPQYILDSCKQKNVPCNIIVSQPRKIAAITISKRVAEERNKTLGTEVGYQVGLHRMQEQQAENTKDPTRILYCTTGVILQKLIGQRTLNAYTHIVLDEVHERDIEIDLLLMVIRRLIVEPECTTKIVLMSATMNIKEFAEFFSVYSDDGRVHFCPPVIDLSDAERNYEIKEFYLDDFKEVYHDGDIEDLMNHDEPGIKREMYDAAVHILLISLNQTLAQSKEKLQAPATILVFLPGLYEIECLHEKLKEQATLKRFEQFVPEVRILHSIMSTEEQQLTFAPSKTPKIILATNIAESGITIPNVTHVIDFCLTKYQATARGAQISCLILDWASKNNCKQRAGRSGRVCEGTVVRMVTKSFYDQRMKENLEPEIKRIGLEYVVLKIKKFNMGSPLEMLSLSLDPPEKDSVVDAVLHLKELFALYSHDSDGQFEYDDGELTYVGSVMASLPVDVRIAKFIVFGYLFGVLEETVIIGAGLSLKSIFAHDYGRKIVSYVQKQNWSNGSQSDCIAILNAYRLWDRNKFHQNHATTESFWCRKHNLDMKNLNEMRLLVNEIKNRLLQVRILTLSNQDAWSVRDKVFMLKIVIAGAFGPANFFKPQDKWCDTERQASAIVNNLDLFSTVYFKNMNRDLVGEVYEQQLRRILDQKGVTNKNAKVKFTFNYKTSEKVFVTFQKDQEDVVVTVSDWDKYGTEVSVGHILPEVYRAVRLRQMDRNVLLHTMNEIDTIEYAVQHNLGTISDHGCFEKTLKYIDNPEWCILPTLRTSRMHGHVTFVEKSGKFYFQPMKSFCGSNSHDFGYEAILNDIRVKLEEAECTSLDKTRATLTLGMPLIVKTTTGLERATFVSRPRRDDVEVHLVDLGHKATFCYNTVFIFNVEEEAREVMKYPPRFFVCTLTETQPSSSLSSEGKWTKEAIEAFKTVVNHKATIQIYSVVDDVASVHLTSAKECWNMKLVHDGFAEEREESYTSKMNHEFRMQKQSESIAPDDLTKEFGKKVDKSHQSRSVPSPPLRDCVERMKLLGPYSPLEIDLNGAGRIYQSKVSIDLFSVNSVMLNDDLLNFHGKFCVASEITMNQKSSHLTLRETTMMPNIPGLAALLALIFSPTVELRRNLSKSRYTSLLAGLGFNMDRQQPYYGERDAAFKIDFELTTEGIRSINQLRKKMSDMLRLGPQQEFPDLVERKKVQTLTEIKTLVLDIINKDRRILSNDTSDAPDLFNWNVDQTETQRRENLHEVRSIFSAIEFPPLHEPSYEEIQQMKQHAEELKSCAKGTINLQPQTCKLCSIDWSTTFELGLHLLSKKHQKRCEELEQA